jgi:hypothetical protein
MIGVKEIDPAVIPDCREAASPESITTISGIVDSGLAGKARAPE